MRETGTLLLAAVSLFAVAAYSLHLHAQEPARPRNDAFSFLDHVNNAKLIAADDLAGRNLADCMMPPASVAPTTKPVPAPPSKVFDHLYYWGTDIVASWALVTSGGIIQIDSLNNPEDAQQIIIGGHKKLGLDPAQIEYLVFTHGHDDHFGGAKYLQDMYHPRVLMSTVDWDMVAKLRAVRPGFAPPHRRNGGRIALPAQIEKYKKAPNLNVTIAHVANGTLLDGFDGKTAWMQNLRGTVTDVASSIDQMRARRAADFYEPLDLKQEYSRMEVAGIASVNGHDTYEVIGYTANDKPERLYFDVVTGLLLRKITVLPSPLGDSPFQVDYDQYRETSSGMRYPFVMNMTPASARSEPSTHARMLVQKVQDNVSIDDTKLAKPPPMTAQ